MSGAPNYTNTNPNAKGGAFNYDARTGLGIASLGGDPNSRLGKEYSGMGDALSSPKGEWDDIDLDDHEKDKYDELKAGIESKIRPSLNRFPTDPKANKRTDTSSFGGLGNSIASVIAAGKDISGNMVSEKRLKQYITEFLISESISGRINVARAPKAPNTGGKNPGAIYSVDKTTSHTNKLDNSASQKSSVIDQNGYTQKAKTPDMYPYSNSGSATTTGAMTVKGMNSDDWVDDDDDTSTYEMLDQTTSKEFYDEENLFKHNSRFK